MKIYILVSILIFILSRVEGLAILLGTLWIGIGLAIILGYIGWRILHKLKILTILLLLLTPNIATAQQLIWIPVPAITSPIIWWTPAHSRTWTARDAWIYQIGPYGGHNSRPGWTNYRPRDTSWGYRQGRPHAKDLGIHGPHIYNHPNPRSLYRPR